VRNYRVDDAHLRVCSPDEIKTILDAETGDLRLLARLTLSRQREGGRRSDRPVVKFLFWNKNAVIELDYKSFDLMEPEPNDAGRDVPTFVFREGRLIRSEQTMIMNARAVDTIRAAEARQGERESKAGH
jgi:hypothetical protein